MKKLEGNKLHVVKSLCNTMSDFEPKHICMYCLENGENTWFSDELYLIEHIQTVHGGRRKDQYNF